MALDWDDLLVGEPGRQWRTVSVVRRVLVIVHNVTAATRLLDVVSLWGGDLRIQTAFTCIGSSAFTTGTAEFLAERGITPVSWETATSDEFDLAVSASYGGPQHEIRAPLIVLPHGMGYNKFLGQNPRIPESQNPRIPESQNPRIPESQNPVFGLSGAWLLHDGRVVPTLAVMSHEEQRDRLARYCPEALDAAFVAGDPCFDRMLASQPLRESYRHRFGIRPDQHCVVVSSTWGEASLFGQQPGLALRLARELPLDEYRIVVALHPNVRHGHTAWQVRMWLDECARAGVVVLPPEEGWRAALVAADITVGDHGSVTFYSAALGTPVLLAAWPEASVDNASPIAALLRTAPRLDPRTDLRDQLDTTIGTHSPRRHADITSLTTSAPGMSATLLRTGIYTQLNLEEPTTPADSTAVPLPTVDTPTVGSQLIEVTLNDQGASAVRLPATALDVGGEGIVVTSTAEPDRRWLELAEVLVDDGRHEDPARWIHASLSRLPGCLLGATRDNSGTWMITGTDLPLIGWHGAPDLGPLAAALVHAWLCTNKPLAELPSLPRVHVGRRTEPVHFEVEQPR